MAGLILICQSEGKRFAQSGHFKRLYPVADYQEAPPLIKGIKVVCQDQG